MENYALEAGDAATWGSTLVTFAMACFAIWQGASQKRDLKRQNELQAEASQLQRRQIETAERRTLVMEQILARMTGHSDAGVNVNGQRPPAAPAPAPAAVDEPDFLADWDVPEDADAVDDAEVVEDAEGVEGGTLALRRPGAWPGPPPPEQRPAPPGGPGTGWGYPQEPPAPAPYGSGAPPGAMPGHGRERRRKDPLRRPLPPTEHSVPSPLRLERHGDHSYALRNTGAAVLTGVRVNPVGLPRVVRNLPEDAVVRPGETVEFLMASSSRSPLPKEIRVRWDGRAEEVPLPVPVEGRGMRKDTFW
ncbi:hypothetical protein ACWGJ2_25575 [Streptomyces sp. NPDC054796]